MLRLREGRDGAHRPRLLFLTVLSPRARSHSRRLSRGCAGQPQAVKAFVCTVQVDSVDDMLATNDRLGGLVALPKMSVPGVGWLAYVKDPDGNIVGLLQPDVAAA